MNKIDWDLYFVTEEKLSKGRSTLEVVKKAAAGGIDVIQLRDKAMDLRECYKLGKKIREITAKKGIDFIVNDRVDLALALSADGVHLGQKDLPLEEARKILGKDKIIGISTSTPEEALKAEKGGADYLGVGAVYSTKSKKMQKDREGIGSAGIAAVRKKVSLPITAIGGIKVVNIEDIIKAGAETIAVITALTGVERVTEKTRKFKTEIRNLKKKFT